MNRNAPELIKYHAHLAAEPVGLNPATTPVAIM